MKLAIFFAMSITLQVSAQVVHWEFNESTGGEDISWISDTSIDPAADQYEYVSDITYIGVDVVFLGVIFGPFDVTSDVDPTLLHSEGIADGPAPIIIMDSQFEVDADLDGDIDITANMLMQINGKGRGQFDITNVFLGDVWVDMGFPFGNQLVQIDRIYMSGQIDITAISFPCPEDINGDGMINVTDILMVIGNWGGVGEGDVNGDGAINVSDILAVVGAWGPC